VRLYNKGWSKLHNDFGLDRIIKRLRDIKLLVKAKYMDDRDGFCIQHHGRNIIYLDDPNDITSDALKEAVPLTLQGYNSYVTDGPTKLPEKKETYIEGFYHSGSMIDKTDPEEALKEEEEKENKLLR